MEKNRGNRNTFGLWYKMSSKCGKIKQTRIFQSEEMISEVEYDTGL